MAAPHVSGAIALLVATAVDLGAEGPDDRYGAGLVAVPAALDAG
jgi:hypothetical protein